MSKGVSARGLAVVILQANSEKKKMANFAYRDHTNGIGTVIVVPF